MIFIIYPIILIVSFIFLMRKKDDTESHLPVKIIGYFILGSFAFKFNQISLPLGFVVYLLFFKPKFNSQVKQKAAVLGVIAFMFVHWILPFAIDEWKSRPITIQHELSSIYTIHFQDEYVRIKQKFKLENNNLVLEDFEVEYTKDGKITELSWQLIEQNDNSYSLYQIRYDIGKSRYRVIKSQLDTWLQYHRLINACRFFENLNMLDIKDITQSKGDFSSYVIKSTGERVNYAIENRAHFVVLNNEIQKLDDEKLPVEGFYISIIAIKKTVEERDERGNIAQENFEGTEISDYLFDVNIIEV